MSQLWVLLAMTRWRRPPISLLEVLEALAEAPLQATTTDVMEQAPARHTRRQIYYGLAKLEQKGLVGKEIVPHPSSIAHAYWEITKKGLEALRRGTID